MWIGGNQECSVREHHLELVLLSVFIPTLDADR